MKSDCFVVAIENLKHHPDRKFCFGQIYAHTFTDRGASQRWITHAWNEDNELCYDLSQDKIRIMKKNEYYNQFGISKYISQDINQVAGLLRMKRVYGWWCEKMLKGELELEVGK